MLKNNQHITSCTITWESSDDILCVVSRVLPKEIQVRFYSGCDLTYGKIWSLDDQSKQNLFDILNKCLVDLDSDNYASDAVDSPRWQFKISSKGSCLRTVFGTSAPPHGSEIEEIISDIIGEENFYFFGR